MTIFPQAEMRVGQMLERVCKGFAFCGGLLLVAMAFLTCASVVGRWINTGPFRAIGGDYELIEAGCAIAIFAFLPYCQLNRGHVTVDVLVDRFPSRIRRLFVLIGDLLIAIVAFVIVWRLYLGWGEKLPYFSQEMRDTLSMGYKPFFPETTYELEIPIWIPMGFALIGACAFFVVSLYTVWRSANEVSQ